MSTLLDGGVFRNELASCDAGEAADYVLDALGDRFTRADLDEQLDKLQTHLSTRGHAQHTISLIRTIAERTYAVEFADDIPLSERVLWPAMGAEAAGMEDARFVRFVDDDGSVTFYATYTAYSGSHISQQLLETSGLQVLHLHALVGTCRGQQGPGAVPAPDPRTLRRHVAVGPRNELDCLLRIIRSLGRTRPCQRPTRAWEVLQLGNCGPPIETDAGWLVLTHGVGPMRTYRIGAILLDLDDPTRILGQLRQPLLSPAAGRAGRLRAQRRLLLRRTRARRDPGDSVRDR